MYIDFVFLVLGGFIGGVINAVAGGGALLVYPLLLGLGVSPISANATTAFAAWPGALSSAYGYRGHLRKLPKKYYWLLLPCLLGGALGAEVLHGTPATSFTSVVPWCILFAVILFAAQPLLHLWLHSRRYLKLKSHHRHMLLVFVALALLVVATYGGYFGAGFGIIMLAFLGLTELKDIQQMNGLKNLAGVGINLVASFCFVCFGLIDWHSLPFLILGSISGGYVGAHFGSRLPAMAVRTVVIAVGLGVAATLFLKS